MKPLNVESPRFRQTDERAVRRLDDMRGEVILEGMQDAPCRTGLPEVALELVASMATVYPVTGFLSTDRCRFGLARRFPHNLRETSQEVDAFRLQLCHHRPGAGKIRFF